jgi:hypothetical protein
MKKQYIPKSAIMAEIEARLSDIAEVCQDYIADKKTSAEYSLLIELLGFLDTLETKELEEDEELTGLEKEVAYGTVERINRKRIPINLKGDLKAKFKNEFNTMWQVIGGIQFAKVAKHIIERLCLEFATWGAYNLKGIGEIGPEEKEKMDTKNT